MLPFLSPGNTTWFAIDGITHARDDPQDTLFRTGTSDYLKTLGVQLVEGRLLDERDGVDAPRSVVVNETIARKYWPRGSALGGRMRLGDADLPPYTIVGVVRDVRERGHTLAQKPLVYLPYAQRLGSFPEYLVVRLLERRRSRGGHPPATSLSRRSLPLESRRR